jgi:uncharacterized membrane protein YgcG
MVAKPILCTACIVAAGSAATTTKSEVNIFPFSTAIPALTPTMVFEWPANTLFRRSEQSTPPPAIDAPHDSAGAHPTATWGLSSQPSQTTPLQTHSSAFDISLPSNLQWRTSYIPWESNHASTTAPSAQAMSEKAEIPGPFSEFIPSRTNTPHDSDDGTTDVATFTPADIPTPILRRTSTQIVVEGSTSSDITPLTMTTTTVTTGGVQMTTRLWQPSKNNAKRADVPGLLMGILALRGVAAANIVPRAESSITSPPSPRPTVSFALHPTSVFDPPPALSGPLHCPDSQERCGQSLCYDPKSRWCCPGKMNVCTAGDQCAEGKSGGEKVYGCAPSDVTNGMDSRITTASVQSTSQALTTMVTTTTRLPDSSKTTEANTLMPTAVMPIGGAGHSIGVPRAVRNLAMLLTSVRAVAFPAPVRGGCCGEFCCKLGEVCARGSNGPKCWADADSVEVTEVNKDEDKSTNEVHTDVESNDDGTVETSVVERRDLGLKPGNRKKGSASRPTIPRLLYIFLLLVPFVVASVPSTAGHAAPVKSTPQISPNQKTFLAKRWSCHMPHQDCGPGCWDPSSEFCCQQPSGDYGLCAADKGESCCADRCCPQGYACQNQGQQYLCVPTDTSERREDNDTANAMEENDPKQKKGGGGGHGSGGGGHGSGEGSAKPGGGSGGAHKGAGSRSTAFTLDMIAVVGLSFLIERVL